MALTERRAALPDPPETALKTCATAMRRAGFKKVETNRSTMLVTGKKRAFGQYTSSQVSVYVSPSPAGSGSEIIVRSQAGAQSLASAASKPSERLVKQFLEALGQDPAGLPPAPAHASTAPQTPPADGDNVEKLEKLHQLLKSGALKRDEFETEKAKILSSS